MSVFSIFKRKLEGDVALYLEQDYYALEDIITKKFGKISSVINEHLFYDLHIDILIINPTKKRNFYTLITLGLGALDMLVPDDLDLDKKEIQNAELVFYLPPNWVFDDSHNNSWPLDVMRYYSRIPADNLTWLGYGHSISNGDFFAENTKLNSGLLLSAVDKKNDIAFSYLPSGKCINFYSIMPLYEEELQFKLKFGVEKLFSLFERNNISFPPVLDINRVNVCRKSKK